MTTPPTDKITDEVMPVRLMAEQLLAALHMLGIGETNDLLGVAIERNQVVVIRFKRDEAGEPIKLGQTFATDMAVIPVDWPKPKESA